MSGGGCGPRVNLFVAWRYRREDTVNMKKKVKKKVKMLVKKMKLKVKLKLYRKGVEE